MHDDERDASLATRARTGDAASTVVSRYWVLPIVRAAIAAATATFVTFSPDHSAAIGLTVFGYFGLFTGIILGGLSFVTLKADRVVRWTFMAQWLATAVIAGPALGLARTEPTLPALYASVIAWALITGALELYSGVHVRRSQTLAPLARDWMTIGGITMLLAVAFLLVPPGLNQQLGGVEDVDGVLTSSVMLVGIFGAYAAIIAVYLTIGGLSLKWGSDPRRAATTPAGTQS